MLLLGLLMLLGLLLLGLTVTRVLLGCRGV